MIKYVVAALIVIAVAYFGFSGSSSVSHISAAQSFTIPLNGTVYFTLLNGTSVSSIFLQGSSNSSALFYVSGTPILVKPIVVASILKGTAQNISTTLGTSANLNVLLVSSTAGQATITLTPLPATLGIKVSPSVAVITPSVVLQGGTFSTPTTTTVTTSIPTTTVAGSATTATTTVATTATTTVASTIPTAQVMAYANATVLGNLIKNFKALYISGQSCTSSLYNSTYRTKLGSAPSGPNVYSSIVTVTPTDATFSISQVGTTLYNVTYSLVAPSASAAGAAVVLEINNNNGALITTNFVSTGPWRGLNTTIIQNNYNFAAGIGNACAALIP
ncbi:MAG: hypothetical protein KGH53_03100 [Candidatus Micrarchaeota archaeon]|nr:hypothetical protein [Candidatus Micrarchaeota archaeon]